MEDRGRVPAEPVTRSKAATGAFLPPTKTLHSHEESAGTDSARMWRTWLTADTAVPQGQAQQVPFWATSSEMVYEMATSRPIYI